MPRPKRIRKVFKPPHFKGFMPIGPHEESNPLLFNFEEYEAIRLCDFELLGQVEASQLMGVSRPTFARIYESARRKVAQAFVHGRAIIFEGGKVYFDSDWYSCSNCGCWFNHPEKEKEVEKCALCGSGLIERYNEEKTGGIKEDICICLECGYEKIHEQGMPCLQELCPDCNQPLVREGAFHQHRFGRG